jgi:hypothetical protein
VTALAVEELDAATLKALARNGWMLAMIDSMRR